MRILCVHQGYELYGSDRSFVASVAKLRALFKDASIVAILPAKGPLTDLLSPVSDTVSIQPIWILRRRHILRLLAGGWLSLPAAILRAVRTMKECDLVYINTVTVIDYLIAARFFRSKVILHVHEIPNGFWASFVLRFLVRAAGVRTIFNSASTRRSYAPLQNTTHVLYNGCPSPSKHNLPEYRRDRRLRVLVIGRLNSWKGQDVLIEACGRLPPEVRRCLDARIVGGSFDSDTALELSLHNLVEQWKCADCISFEPFSEKPESWYQWTDIVVVPSKLPEPFGRVAIEAMSFGKALIVSATGGLVEIVQDGLNGWHVSPNDPLALARALSRAVSEPESIVELGRQGRQRFEKLFRQEIIDEEFAKIVYAQIARTG